MTALWLFHQAIKNPFSGMSLLRGASGPASINTSMAPLSGPGFGASRAATLRTGSSAAASTCRTFSAIPALPGKRADRRAPGLGILAARDGHGFREGTAWGITAIFLADENGMKPARFPIQAVASAREGSRNFDMG